MDEAIAAAYADAEGWLLRLVAEAVAAGATGTAEVYQARLDALQALMQESGKRLNALEEGLPERVADAITEAYQEGTLQATVGMDRPSPPSMPDAALSALAVEATTALASQRLMVLRSVEDGYREVVKLVTERAVSSGMDINRAMQEALDQFANRGITAFVDKRGRRYTMDVYTRMALRTARNNATNQGRIDGFIANDINLIQTSWHRAAAPMCIPYQGRILSLDGQAGPRTVWSYIDDAEVTIDVTATIEEALEHGYHHPNCGHIDAAYIPGTDIPDYPDVPEEEHEEKQRQRAIERNIRHWKRREAVAITPAAQQQAKAKVRAWQAAQRAHVKKFPYLRRNYARERLWTGQAGNATARILPTPTTPSTPLLPPSTFAQVQYKLGGSTTPRVSGRGRGYSLHGLTRTQRREWSQVATDANPGWQTGKVGYKNNCARVVNATELRRRGYDVNAGPGTYKTDGLGDAEWAYLESITRNRMESGIVKSGTYVSNVDVAMAGWRTSDGAIRVPQAVTKAGGSRNKATVEMFRKGVPEGATGFAEGIWRGRQRGRTAHTWNWVKQDGEIKFFEAQSGRGFIPNDAYLDRLSDATLRMVRVDDLTPTDDILKVIDHEDGRRF